MTNDVLIDKHVGQGKVRGASSLFPFRLRTVRTFRGFTQMELAERAGLKQSAISHFETGARKPSFDNLRLVADSLDVATDYLLGRIDEFRN